MQTHTLSVSISYLLNCACVCFTFDSCLNDLKLFDLKFPTYSFNFYRLDVFQDLEYEWMNITLYYIISCAEFEMSVLGGK